MSLIEAKMASKLVRRRIAKLAGLVALGLVCTSHSAIGQENLLREATPQAPAVNLVPDPNAVPNIGNQAGAAEERPAEGQDVVSLKPIDGEQSPSDQRKPDQKRNTREPLVLPPLGTPNTSIKGLGTGSTPEDMVAGRLPPVVSLPFGSDRYGAWALDYKTWIAPVYCHQPTYFEDVMLERHGHERCPSLQPLLSGTRFFSDVALMPYNAYLNPPLKNIPNTGYYRPGSTAPCLRQRPTYDKGAIRFQLLTTGTSVLAFQP
jgi:hypothetical protein